ncbi:MAG: hypothetical protein ACI4HZ_11070 [Ruminococcus sp.]
MASCKDCLHYDVCEARITADENYPERKYTEYNDCSNFKDRNRFIELPCKVGDRIYKIGQYVDGIEFNYVDHFEVHEDCVEIHYDPWGGMICETHQVGKIVKEEFDWNGYFLTQEEAEQALELNKK